MSGKWIWYELLTNDVAGAIDFYTKVVGWKMSASHQPDMDYQMWQVGDDPMDCIGGVMQQPEPMAKSGAPPMWLGYIQVDDVDAACAAIETDGGKKWMEMTIPNVGRFATVNDPQHAALYVMQPEGTGESKAFAVGKVGHIGWNEYHGKDGEAALGFYAKHFGWTADEPYDMGPMGKYHLFSIDGQQSGGIMTDSTFPNPVWMFYFNVEDIAAAKSRVETAGGTVMHGPHEVPGGQMILVAKDPQGGLFGLLTAPKST